jgi:transcriptional regulator with XRE-family HTH domain
MATSDALESSETRRIEGEDNAMLGEYIRERRHQLGLSQEQLAERVGGTYSQGDISRLERGHIELPHLETLIKLASVLEVPVGNLLIAGGWFDDGHFAAMPTLAEGDEQGILETVLGNIQAHLDRILELEREAQTRSDRLWVMIRDLKATSGLSVTMTEQEQQDATTRP